MKIIISRATLAEKVEVTPFWGPSMHTEDLKFFNQGRTTLFKKSINY